MNPIPNRIVVYSKDVMNITGQNKRTARRLLARIRAKYNKPKGSYVSIEEFCEFTGFKEQRIIPFLL